ncbi:MAG: CDP-diacylglycerol--serine O-phosphatidyltransferase [Cyclobacteriaceae bacterium]
MKVLKHLPNTITCCNVLCGSIGIMFIFQNKLEWATYMVWAGAFFDFFDGLVARLVKASSAIGKELDSLADMITFGALPGFYVYKLIGLQDENLAYAGFLIIVFSALRLAKFNVDTRQSENFIGLPTPANTIFITSLPFLAGIKAFAFVTDTIPLIIISVVFSLLLVAEVPLISLKFKNFSWQSNKFRFILIACALIMLVLFGVKALSLVVIIYLLISLFWNLIDKPVVE